MDFDDTSEERAYREDAHAWLSANAQLKPRGADPRAFRKDESEAQMVAGAKEWQARKFDAGYAAITWPKEFGGAGGTAIQQLIYTQEQDKFLTRPNIFGLGLGMCLPTIRHFGAEAQKTRFLRAGLRGEEMWCQLFSEPGSGSDLAGARTKAVRDADHWRVSGQKIWTTYAQYCDFGLLLARTDPSAPKHAGLTMFIIDMRASGVEVRPLKQLSGESEFNEVFFDDARLPDSWRIGEIGQGWKVALGTLMFERQHAQGIGFLSPEFMLELARDADALSDARVRDRIADLYLNTRALQLLNYRAQTALSRGQMPGPEQSISKLVNAAQGQQASYLAMELMGQDGLLTADTLGDRWRSVEFAWAWGAAMRIAGGSDEILRNIIAERVLGLPQDPRNDKDIPFEKIAAV